MTRTSGRPQCACGRPIHDGAHLCGHCVTTMREQLRKIIARRDDLLAALTAAEHTQAGPGGNHADAVGLNLAEPVIRARTKVTDLAWFTVQVLRDDFDDLGRTFTPPRAGADSFAILAWVERWHLPHLTATTTAQTAQELADDVAAAEQATWDALEPTRWVDVNLTCDQHGTSDLGERVPCGGQMRAKVGRGKLPDLVCNLDPSHRVSPAQWERAQWRRTKQLDEAGMRALVARIVS